MRPGDEHFVVAYLDLDLRDRLARQQARAARHRLPVGVRDLLQREMRDRLRLRRSIDGMDRRIRRGARDRRGAGWETPARRP